jgi:hypothetical protein
MKEIFFNILRFLGAIAGAIAGVAVLVYIRWKSLESRVKDLGNGGIQTIFESRKPK